jgi:hypothetical protein
MRVFHAPPLESFKRPREWYPLSPIQFARLLICRRRADLCQVLLRRRQGAAERRRLAVVGGMERGRDDDAGVEIDRMLGLVGQPCPTVFQLGDLGLWIGLANPLFVRSLLPLRLRSMRTRSSAVGVAMPLSLAICVSISR